MKLLYFKRTCKNRCPRCGEGKVLKDLFTRHDTCDACHLKYDRENGFFLGGIPVSYALICTFWIVPWLIAYFFGWAPVLWTVIGSISGAIAFTYLGYAYCQCLWLGIYFCFAKNEMPVLDRTEKKWMSDFKELLTLLEKFRDDRDWGQFHDSKNLALALSIEAAELNELFPVEKRIGF